MGGDVRSVLRDQVVRQIVEQRSLVLTGEMGVGKSHLLAAAIGELRTLGWVCTPIWANPAAATIPFGALAAFAQGNESGDRLEVLRSTVAALAVIGDGRQHLITIDDAPLLDDQSIAVLHQLCTEATIPLLATARSTDEERESLASLWKSVGADRVVVDPLDDHEAAQLAAVQLRAATDSPKVERIVKRSAGNPLFIGELVRAEIDDAPGGLTPRLQDVVGARISRLDDLTRHQLLLVAVADPLDTDLDIVDGPSIERLENAGLITTADADDDVLARPAHPLYGEIVRARLSALQRKAVARELTVAMQKRPTVRRGDALRLAGWLRACGDEPSAQLAVPAALEAISLLDADLANELVAIAVSVEPDYSALFAAGEIARLTGDVEQALAWFERAFDEAEAAQELRSVAYSIGQILLSYRNQPDEALRVFGLAADRLTDPVQRLELETERAMFGSLHGRHEDVLVAAARILDDPGCDHSARWIACTNASWAEAQLVDLRNIHAHLDQALAIASEVASERTGEVDLVHAVGVNARMEEGSFDDAVNSAVGILDRSGSSRGAPAGLTSFSVSQVEWMRGNGSQARLLTDSALDQLAPFDVFNAYPFVLGSSAILAIVAGDIERAQVDIAVAVDRGGVTRAWDQIWLGRARAWLAVSEGDTAAALELAVRAGDVAIETTHRGWAVLALHDAIAWGGAGAVAGRLGDLRSRMHDAPLFELLAENARTLVDGDVGAISAEIDRLRAFGTRWHAGVMSAGMALRCIEIGDAVEAGRHATAARLWMSTTCPQHPKVMDAALSSGRLAVVESALAGSTSREIAEERFLSIRTVDTHLGAAYSSLGVSGRAELVSLYGDPTCHGAVGP